MRGILSLIVCCVLAIVITGQGNHISVQVDDGVCIEFKMNLRQYTSVNSKGEKASYAISEYTHWRVRGEKKWHKYEKKNKKVIRSYMKPSETRTRKTPITGIFKAPKYRQM